MLGAPARAVLVLLSVLWCALGGGCVTAKKYRLAAKETTPAALDWREHAADAAVTVRHVIVFKGPGSWKKEARWDEYVVVLQNAGSVPLTIERAELIDMLGESCGPGSEPWALEKASYTNWERYGKTGIKVLAGAGAVTLYAGAVVAESLGAGLAGAGAAGGSAVVLDVIPVVAVVDIAVVAVMNHHNRKAVEAEFARRRLGLPLSLAPGEERAGSFFFAMTPGPKALVVRASRGAEQIALRVPLPELATLHLKPAPKRQLRR